MTALFNAVSRSKRLNPIIDKKNEKRKSGGGRARRGIEKDKLSKADALVEKIEESKQKLSEKQESKWSVLDDNMVEKATDLQNWDVEEKNDDNWDEDVDL